MRTKKNTSCPYCLGPMADAVETVTCPRCGTVHHAECWRDNGRCSVHGCDGWVVWSNRIGKRLAPQAPDNFELSRQELDSPRGPGPALAGGVADPVDNAEYRCIECGGPVPKNKLVCASCRLTIGNTHFLENCFGPSVILLAGFAGIVVLVVRAVT
ncbi:MAG: RING finger protein [Armatimonadota bacterium]